MPGWPDGCKDAAVDVAAAAFESLAAEVSDLLPASAVVVDAHTHLGRDEDGQALEPAALLAALDEVGPNARACTTQSGHPPTACQTTASYAGRVNPRAGFTPIVGWILPSSPWPRLSAASRSARVG